MSRYSHYYKNDIYLANLKNFAVVQKEHQRNKEELKERKNRIRDKNAKTIRINSSKNILKLRTKIFSELKQKN